MKEFGQKVYQDYIYINFDSNSRMSELFSSDLNPQRLILGLELYSGKKILPSDTLIIFDEVREVPRALSSLKYFARMHLNTISSVPVLSLESRFTKAPLFR